MNKPSKLFNVQNLKTPPPPRHPPPPPPPVEPQPPQNIRLHAVIEEVETEEEPEEHGGVLTKPTIVFSYAGELRVTFEVYGKEHTGIPFTCEAISEDSCAALLAAFIRRGN